jgi:hypothetical protein
MDWRWASAAVAVASVTYLATSARIPASRIVAGHELGAEAAELEARVSRDPDDAQALRALVGTYLEHRAPGLAQAALDRAPVKVRDLPAIADARAQALSALGRTEIALGVQQRMLATCAATPCSPELLGRASRRARFLSEMVRLGVDDPREQPELALVAYRRSSREARLDTR